MKVNAWKTACILAALAPLAAAAPANEATDAMNSPQEEAANAAMWSIKPAEPPEIIRQKVTDWLQTYPSSRRRREVRRHLVQTAVQAGRTADTVEECMRQGFDLGSSYLGEMVLRDDWAAMASLFEKQGRLDGAAQVRVGLYLRLPYQLENRQQLALAVTELSKAGMHAQVLATGKLALAVLPEAESGPVLEAVKRSLAATQGKDAAARFEAFWQNGTIVQDGGDPLAEVPMPGRDRLRKVAEQALATKGLLLDGPAVVAMQKGVLHLFAGDLQQAAGELQEAVALSPPDARNAAADQAAMYFRWLDGSAARARQYRAYARYGKSGPDGATGTADDLANPFVEATGTGQVTR